MISLTNPYYLWFLVSIPLLVFSHFTLLKYNQYKALKFANFEAIRRVTGKRWKISGRRITEGVRRKGLFFDSSSPMVMIATGYCNMQLRFFCHLR